MTAGFTLRSKGYWLEAIAPYGEVETAWTWGDSGGGLESVSWRMDLPYDFDHPALRRGARVEVMDGAECIGQATLAEPGRSDSGRSFSALGIYRQAEVFLCLDGSNETTTIADTAIDAAHSRGCPIYRTGSFASTAMKTGDITEGLNYLSTLFSTVAVETGKRWWVDSLCRIRLNTDPTIPTWHLVPGVADPGSADDEYAAALFGRYQSGSVLATAVAEDQAASDRFGYAERGVDMTDLGSITGTRATNRLAGLLALGRSKLTFTDRLEVDSNQLLTAGGRPAPLSMVRGGQLVRAHGLQAYSQWLNGNPWLDFVIGEAVWANGADTISLAPVGLAARTFEDLLAQSAPGNLKP